MTTRPGDSDLDFDLDADAPSDESIESDATILERPEPDATADFGDGGQLPDSHVLGGMMIPHWSDGSTEVLVRRTDPAPDQVPETTEPMFPRQTGAPLPDPGDAETVELPRVDFASLNAAAVPHDQPASTGPGRTSSKSPAEPGGGSRLLIVLLISYASAVTVALIYFLATRGLAPPILHPLENLQDPAGEQGTVRIIERGAELPPGHVLQLAEGRRFGNILVEPLRLTRGPIEFVHFSGDSRNRQPPSPPVLKLWLRLTNLSDDQPIAPLDALLLYKRAINRSGALVANNFVCRRVDQRAGHAVFTYPTSQHSEWDMRGQHLGRVLQPGESIETFIPTDPEGIDGLTGELMWRFQLRKGYAGTGRGVTTLVDVAFHQDDIAIEPEPMETPDANAKPRRQPQPKPARRPSLSLRKSQTDALRNAR